MAPSNTSGQRSATPLDVYTPTYGSFPEPDFGDAETTDSKIQRFGFFAQDQMKMGDRFNVRAGLRQDRVRNTVVGGESTTDWATTGNVGVVYEVPRAGALHELLAVVRPGVWHEHRR